jgi:diguanylate cyclase (GGDEF)-like protein
VHDEEEHTKIEAFLKKVGIFSSLSGRERCIIAKLLVSMPFAKGQIIFRQGDSGDDLFIIQEGQVASSLLLPNGKQKEIVVFEKCNFFGEMAIFDNAARSATCIAKEDTVCLKLGKKDFFSLMSANPRIAIEVMYKMLNATSQRLRNTSKFLLDMVRWGSDASRRAITDEITGAYNRRYLDNALDDLFVTAKNSGKMLSLIMGDVDYFRKINETYGHDVGDKTIVEVVRIFKKHLRQKDVLARYGGDELTVILPETHPEEAFSIAENIRQSVSCIDIFASLDGALKHVTTSQGIASFPQHAEDLVTLKKKADQALYKAKEMGRNRVFCIE